MKSHNYSCSYRGLTVKQHIYYPLLNNSAVIKKMISNKVWEKNAVDIFIDNINKTDIVIDCGAYIGTHTLFLSQLCKKVIAFEPNNLIFECLKNTCEFNSNIELNNSALFNEKTTIQYGTNNDGDSSIEGMRKKRFNENYLINCEKLDDYNFNKVDFIKIDVEGAEFKVLEGAENTIKKFKPKIIIEVFKNKKDKLLNWLKDNKYEIKTQLNGENYFLTPQ